jgi:hypothetical protein
VKNPHSGDQIFDRIFSPPKKLRLIPFKKFLPQSQSIQALGYMLRKPSLMTEMKTPANPSGFFNELFLMSRASP